jgi:hypothetical protein
VDEVCDLGGNFWFEPEHPFVALKHKRVLLNKSSNRVDLRHKNAGILRELAENAK